MFELGEIVSREQIDDFIKNLAEIDDEMLELYTGIFSEYICKMVQLCDLDYSRIDRAEEFNLIKKYTENIETMQPIVTSPVFDEKRIVYDGCHRCVALENLNIKQVIALVPYKTNDGRLVEDLEVNKPHTNKCKYGECDKGKCCLCCDYKSECGGICTKCFEVGVLHKVIEKNVALFCDGIW